MSRYIVIGDIHGCIHELRELIQKLCVTDEDFVISAGDLVYKGPDSAAVVKYFREMHESRPVGKTVVVNGNHEEKHTRFRRHYRLFKEQGKPIPTKKADELMAITEAMSPEDITFLDTVPVLYHKIPEHNALVVHAGVPPSVTFLPPVADIAVMPRSKQDKYNQLLRVRFVDPSTGYMVPLGDEREQDRYWAELYSGQHGFVYFGHQPFHTLSEPKQYAFASGLDLGAVFGGHLCAAVLEAGQPVRYVTVKAHRQYAPVRQEE